MRLLTNISLLLITANSLFGQNSTIDSINYINSNFYSIYSDNYLKGLEATKRAVQLSKIERSPRLEAEAQKNVGIVYYLTGDYESALEAYLTSYNLFDSLADQKGVAKVTNEMGNYYRKLGYSEKAKSAWKQSEAISREINDLETLGTSLGMQAQFYWERGEFTKSDPLYIECFEIRKQQKDSVGLGYILLDISDIHRRRKEESQALSYIQQSISIRNKIGDNQGLLESYKFLADFYHASGRLDSARKYYLNTAMKSSSFDYPDLARASYDSLASILFKQQDYKTAYRYKELAEGLEDSLFNISRNRQIAEIQTKYETEKKEQQLELQDAQLSENKAQIQRNRLLIVALIVVTIAIIGLWILNRSRLKKQQQLMVQEERLNSKEAEINAAISSQEKERARYARDLHDGFGQMISILNLNLKNLKTDTKPDERLKTFEESEKVINEMYDELKSICFDLMPQTLVKNGLQSALVEFTNRINTTGQVFIETNFFGLEKRPSELQEISFYRISQEWINNILKYSDADKITLQITRDEAELTLLIEDNGSGFDKSSLINSKGNGWKNLNTRTNIIRGSLELETKPGVKGNTLIVNAPATLTLEQKKLEV